MPLQINAMLPNELLLPSIKSCGLDNTENKERLFFYCYQLSTSIAELKTSITKYEIYKQNKKNKLALEVDNDRN
jgi:hypothetical protein